MPDSSGAADSIAAPDSAGRAVPDSVSISAAARTPGPGFHGPSPGGAALRSMVLPGWGQAYDGKWIKAGLFLGAYAGLWAWSISIHQDRMDAIGKLHAAADDAGRAHWQAEVDRLENDRNGKYWLAGLVLLLSMADAYVDAQLFHFDRRMDAPVALVPAPAGDGLALRVTVPLDPGGEDRRAR